MLRDRGVNTRLTKCLNSVLNVKALVGAFNQEKALVGAFSVIVQPVVEPMDRFAVCGTTYYVYTCNYSICSDLHQEAKCSQLLLTTLYAV